MKPIALSTIRKQNLRSILDLLTLSPSVTRQELSEATGLSLMTVTNLVDALKEQQVLCFTPVQRDLDAGRAYGRKAELISLRGDTGAWLLVDISGRQFSLMLLGFDIKPILEMKDEETGSYLQRLERFLCKARERVEDALEGRTLLGVSVITPGPYNISSDTVFNERVDELNGVRIKSLLQRCLGDYDYYVDEDVKFAVRTFQKQMEEEHCEVLYYLFLGEGVGGAAVHSGNMLRGHNATAGDAGQLTDPEGNTYESRLNLAAYARLLGLDGDAPPEKIREEIESLRETEGEKCLKALEMLAGVAAEMLYSILWLLDPTHIIIDCRYAAPYTEEFSREVERRLGARFQPGHRSLPVISAAPQGVSSVLRGAVHVLQREWVERKF